MRFIVAALGLQEEDICYACFTGKAAQVLLSKGNKNVYTLHRLLFTFRPNGKGGFIRLPVEGIPHKVVIVDECSMAPKELVVQLFKYPVHVIFLGDPGQLPPINPEDDNKLLAHPHLFLDEIHRQAQESEIIRLSMDVRTGRPLELFDGKDVKIIKPGDLVDGMYQWADQILCAKNATRVSINNEMRSMLGKIGSPQEGDKVICLRNYWDHISNTEDPLINGTIGYLQKPFKSFLRYPMRIAGGGTIETIESEFITETGASFGALSMDYSSIIAGKKGFDWRVESAMHKDKRFEDKVPLEFTYGYAITVHKAQGSEWDKVLVLEENFPFDKEDHRRWLYTAVTRAAEKLVLVRKD